VNEEKEPEQTGAEQSDAERGTPGSGAEEVPRPSPEDVPRQGDQPTQEELRQRIEEQLRNLRVEDLMVESVVSVLNLTARRIAKEDERDLEQARVGIEAVRAWVELLPEEPATQIRNALSELQLLYAQATEEAGAGKAGTEREPPGAEQSAADRGTPRREAEDVPGRGGEPQPRLWTPPGSS
jgi:hypothetical protein